MSKEQEKTSTVTFTRVVDLDKVAQDYLDKKICWPEVIHWEKNAWVEEDSKKEEPVRK